MDVIRGRAWKYGDNVNTDVIYPGKYTYTVSGREEIARHALEDLDPAFVTGMQPGDVIVAGHTGAAAPAANKRRRAWSTTAWKTIVAESFGQIFYRNALNNGTAVIVCPEAARVIQPGDAVEVDITSSCVVRCPAKRVLFPAVQPKASCTSSGRAG